MANKKQLDLVLINPGSRIQIYQSLGSTLAAVEPPVWAGLMATFVRNRGFSVHILDANAENLSPEETAQQVADMNPLLIAVVVYGHQPSASTQNMTAAGAICTAVKQKAPDLKTLLVGGHVAALPERTLREEDVDFVCGGEGPYTILDLLQALKSTQRPNYSKVRDLWYWEGETMRSNPPAPLIKDLNGEMPDIAWNLLPMERYRAHNWHCFGDLQRQPYAALYTTLGCPYHCHFCLAEGTKIVTLHGRNKRIEELRIGDKLIAWDEENKRLAETAIVAMGNRLVKKILRIKSASGQTISTTHEHPIYTSRGWVEASNLKVGDQVLLMDKHDKVQYLRRYYNPAQRAEVRANLSAQYEAIVEIEEVEGEFKVYNFQCSPYDNYFAEFILVHNCCIQAPFKSGEAVLGIKTSVNSYRMWSPEKVLEQIDLLVNQYGVRNIKIADEMFVLNPKHVMGICDLIIERGYDLNIWAYARVDTVREEMVHKLKRAGFNWLAFGIEAANERVRNDVQKGFDQEEVYKTIQAVRAAGISVIGNFIFGLPEDDLETMQATLDMALELNCEFANFYCAVAYPGSPLYNMAIKEGWPLPERWSGYSQHAVDTLPLPTRYLSAAEVLRFRDHAFQVYFNTPRYLDMITQKFGPETTQHIREMASHRLVRKYV